MKTKIPQHSLHTITRKRQRELLQKKYELIEEWPRSKHISVTTEEQDPCVNTQLSQQQYNLHCDELEFECCTDLGSNPSCGTWAMLHNLLSLFLTLPCNDDVKVGYTHLTELRRLNKTSSRHHHG